MRQAIARAGDGNLCLMTLMLRRSDQTGDLMSREAGGRPAGMN